MRGLASGAVWVISAAAAGAVLWSGSAFAAGAGGAAAWVITPTDEVCQTDIELTGRSGAVADVSLESDGDRVALRFVKDEIPQRAFLPIRIDQRPYANLVTRPEASKRATMLLSVETQTALRRGAALQIAWLADEPLRASLAGSEQGMVDLRICGAQVSAQHRARLAGMAAEQARQEADARVKALADEQLAAARAQTAAAQAERERIAAEVERAAAEAQRQQMLADSQRRQAEAQRAAAQEAERQQAYAAQWQDQQPARRYSAPDDDVPPWAGRRYDPRYDDGDGYGQ